ncbi:MAG TPA: DUF5671 domain-containing protein [Candidatus Binataceae bacterium]|nr:DUF5671 domain-containing protein [Candidatus Binataceae bacterium]
MEEQSTKGSSWDIFIHLFAVIALYIAITAVIESLFGFIAIAFPDPLDWQWSQPHETIRYSLAFLIIFFPAYCWAWRQIESDLTVNPGKRRLRARTFPIYLTLCLAGLIILSDLAYLVYYFLDGDLTVRFLLKVGALMAVAGSVMWFYLNALRREPGPMPAKTTAFAWCASAAVAALVITGFVLTGSPFKLRLARLDLRKIADISEIDRHLRDYAREMDALPATVDQIRNAGYMDRNPPADPETNVPYEYRVTGTSTVEYCADFHVSQNAESIKEAFYANPESFQPVGNLVQGDWEHPAGHYCFKRTVQVGRHPTADAGGK